MWWPGLCSALVLELEYGFAFECLMNAALFDLLIGPRHNLGHFFYRSDHVLHSYCCDSENIQSLYQLPNYSRARVCVCVEYRNKLS